MTMSHLTLLSGGMDSTVLAYRAAKIGRLEICLSFNYGQRHKKELEYASRTAEKLGADHHIIDLSQLAGLLPGSSLTDTSVEVPEGHYADETMKSTVVPNRNAIMLSIAFGVAAAHRIDFVGIAAHNGDEAIYPDCRPSFMNAVQLMESQSLKGLWVPNISTPFISSRKEDIAKEGQILGVDFTETWSCYKGGEKHCGECGTCVERREAFTLASIEDPTDYED